MQKVKARTKSLSLRQSCPAKVVTVTANCLQDTMAMAEPRKHHYNTSLDGEPRVSQTIRDLDSK